MDEKVISTFAACISERLSSPVSFSQWLKDKGDKDVGRAGTGVMCPLHEFLVSACPGMRCAVYGQEIWILSDDQEDIVYKVRTPKWAVNFQEDLDGSAVHYSNIVYAPAALKILNHDPGWMTAIVDDAVFRMED